MVALSTEARPSASTLWLRLPPLAVNALDSQQEPCRGVESTPPKPPTGRASSMMLKHGCGRGCERSTHPIVLNCN